MLELRLFSVWLLSMLFQQIASDAPVVLSSPSAVNVSLGSTVTFTCTVQQVHFLNWFINGSLNAEHNPFNGVQRVLSQNSTVIAKELQLEATLPLNQSEVSCLAGNIHGQLVSSSRAQLLVQGLLAGVGDLNAVKILSPPSVFLTWTPPYTLENVPITGYNVTTTRVHSGGVTHSTYNGPNTTLSLSDTCENYVFSVVPINAVGNGPPSTVAVNYLQEPVLEMSSTEVLVITGSLLVNMSLKVTHSCQGVIEDYIWIKYNGQTRQFGPFKSADGQITLLIDSVPQDELISMTVWAGNMGGNTSQKTVSMSTYDVQSATASYNRQQSSMCVVCGFMSGSMAVGCAAKIILQNKTASEFTLRVLRGSPSEQEISGCANHLDAGRYQLEVFDIEESGVLGSTAAIVMDVTEGMGGTPRPSVALPPPQRPTQTVSSTPLIIDGIPPTGHTSTDDPYGPIRYTAIALSVVIISLCVVLATLIICYVRNHRRKQSRTVSGRRQSLTSRSRSRQSNDYEEHQLSLPSVQVRQLPAGGQTTADSGLLSSSDGIDNTHHQGHALLHLRHMDNLDVPSLMEQSVTDLESVTGWLRAQDNHHRTNINRNSESEDDLTDEVHLHTGSAEKRSLPPVPWYAADSADVVEVGAVQREEPPPPYDNDMAAVQQRTNQPRNQVSSHKPNDVTYIELDFTRHSQGRNSLSSANNSRVQLVSNGSQPVNYAVVRGNRHYHTQYTTVNSLV